MKPSFFLLLLGLIFFTAHGWSQEPAARDSFPDLLYLKDGSVLQGRLLKYIQGKQIYFRLTTGDEVTYPEREIQRFVQGGALAERVPARAPKPYAFREEGLYVTFHAGAGVGRNHSNGNTVAWNLLASAGHQFNRWLGLGGGLAVDGYYPANGEVVYPLFAEVRGYLTETREAPFYVVRTGYGLTFKETNNGVSAAEGGLYLNPSLGMRWGASAGINIISEIGFQYQRAEYTRSFGGDGGREIQTKKFKRLSLRLGMVF
jgi:hypothetical protein